VIARSAARLDLLSGGRFELGIGAGGFWDAIEAMGGRRLTAGESIDALEEAIRIIREIWATDERGGVRLNGRLLAGQWRQTRPRACARHWDMGRCLQVADPETHWGCSRRMAAITSIFAGRTDRSRRDE
jgi:alkanesulfonate monooxygenase SsuD/methylene tetrahydromethanopterin reductase-like flavin-dependent oxidoreductase (luciferase family)